MPEPARPIWGWTGPARGLLIVAAGSLSIALLLASWRSPAASEVVPFAPLVVDPNSAPAAVLEALPGIGPVLASRVVEGRDAAPFRSLADLDRRVKGIGPVTAAALKPFLRFDGPTPSPPTPKTGTD